MGEDVKDLSASEARIMKIVWDGGGVVPMQEIIERLKNDYGKDYSRNSVTTFITRMAEKGYVDSYKKGRNAYIVALRNRDEYAYQQLCRAKDMWYAGKASNLMSALVKRDAITREEISEIRRIFDELDD